MVALQELVEHFVDIKAISKEAVAARSQGNADRVRVYACEVQVLDCCSWSIMTEFERQTECKSFVVGGTFYPSLKLQIELTILLRLSHSWLITNTYSAPEWVSSCSGHAQLIFMDGLIKIYRQIYIIMEHLNCQCKDAISGLGANITERSIERVGRCLRRLKSILCQYDSVNRVPQVSGSHTKHSVTANMQRLLTQLMESDVFQKKSDRFHNSFPNFVSNVIKQVSRGKPPAMDA